MMSFAVLAIVKATLVCGVALFLSRLCRRTRASIRHLLLVLAFAALVAILSAGRVLPTVAVTVRAAATAPAQGTQEMASAVPSSASASPSGSSAPSVSRVARNSAPEWYVTVAQVITVAWLIGVAIFLMPVVAGFWQMRRLRESASPWIEGQALVDRLASALGVHRRVDAVLHDAVTSPMTCGVLRPSIIMPASARQWDEVSLRCALRHELEHVARWDFLTHCLSRMVCAVYWFHPLAWAAWRRMRLEAERACDDAVLREDDAATYAALLVSMAQRQLSNTRRPLLAMAGRADLAARIAAVLDRGLTRGRIGRRRAAGLIVTGAIAILGVTSITVVRAMPQTQTTGAAAPVASAGVSIKRNPPAVMRWSDGQLVATNVTVRELLIFAFGVADVDNAPYWARSDRFDVVANVPVDIAPKPPKPDTPPQGSKNLQAFMAERFKLVAHPGEKEFPIYALVLARPDRSLGPRITPSQMDCTPDPVRARFSSATLPPLADTNGRLTCGLSSTHGRIEGRGVTIADLADHLFVGSRFNQQIIDRPLIDRTGLSDRFDVTLQWMPDDAAPGPARYRPFTSVLELSSPRLLAALQEQLGLKLESQLAPKPVLVIDSIEPPTEN